MIPYPDLPPLQLQSTPIFSSSAAPLAERHLTTVRPALEGEPGVRHALNPLTTQKEEGFIYNPFAGKAPPHHAQTGREICLMQQPYSALVKLAHTDVMGRVL